MNWGKKIQDVYCIINTHKWIYKKESIDVFDKSGRKFTTKLRYRICENCYKTQYLSHIQDIWVTDSEEMHERHLGNDLIRKIKLEKIKNNISK